MKLKKFLLGTSFVWSPLIPIITTLSCDTKEQQKMHELLEINLQKSFKFFNNIMNKNSGQGYGLVPDRYFVNNPELINNYHHSNDALGWLLCAIVIGIEKKWIEKELGKQQIKKIIKTILQLPHYYGFPVHFSNRDGTARKGSEYSSATAFLIFGGLIVASSYLDDSDINSKVDQFIQRINWSKWITKTNGKSYIKMSYQKEDGDYGSAGYHGKWDMSAEQQLLYLLYAANESTKAKNAQQVYRSFNRKKTGLANQFVQEPGGTLFTYQFSHSYIDFKKINTNDKVDWHENTKQAIMYDRKISSSFLKRKFNIISSSYYGLTANDAANGKYRVAGTNKPLNSFDGWFAPWAQIGCLSYDDKALKDVYNLYKGVPNSWDEKYGFLDGYSASNLYSSGTILPLNKGMAMVAIANYQNRLIWDLFMQSKVIKQAMVKLNWQFK